MSKNSAKNSARPQTRHLKPFKPGQSGNLRGRPLGSRNRRTVILDAIRRIAEKKDMTPQEIEEAIQTSGIEKAIKGSFFHYAEISNGLYGKITDKSEVEVKDKTLAGLIAMAHGGARPGHKKARKASAKV